MKAVTTPPPQALLRRTNIKKSWFYGKPIFYEKIMENTKGPSSIKTNGCYAKITKIEILRNVFQVLSKDIIS